MRTKRFFGLVCLLFAFLFASLLTVGAFATGESYGLTLSLSSEEAGSLQVLLDGVEPMENQDLSVKEGVKVSVTALALVGYAFDHWELDADLGLSQEALEKAELNFTMPAQKVSVTAHFRQYESKFTVFVASAEYGSGNFAHKDYPVGQTVSVEAMPIDGFRFVRWIDDNGALKNSAMPEGWEKKPQISFTMPAWDVQLTPEFEAITYYFTVKIEGEGDVEIVGKEKNEAGKYECTAGEELTISAAPAADFLFLHWVGTNSVRFTDYDKAETSMTCPASDFTVTANFASSIRKLTIDATQGGNTNPLPGVREVGVGNIVTVTATPLAGFAFSHWECSSEKGRFDSTKDSETGFTMPDEDCTVTAIFIRGGYRLTLAATAGGEAGGEVGMYEMGEKVAIEAAALEGYVFSHWKSSVSGAVKDPQKAMTEVTIPGEDVKITAVFVLKASLASPTTAGAEEEESDFRWVIFLVIFLLSLIAITLVILRDRLNLSYRYLVAKWVEGIVNKLKK